MWGACWRVYNFAGQAILLLREAYKADYQLNEKPDDGPFAPIMGEPKTDMGYVDGALFYLGEGYRVLVRIYRVFPTEGPIPFTRKTGTAATSSPTIKTGTSSISVNRKSSWILIRRIRTATS